MKVTSRATVGPGGTLRLIDSAAPLTVRRVRSDDAGTCALRLVGTAAGPLPGDELRLLLDVDDDALAELGAAGASIAQGRQRDDRASAAFAVEVRVGERGGLVADPGPLIVCDGAHVDVSLQLTLGVDAAVRWDETVVLGRHCDAGTGTATIRWDVTRGGRPVLRQLLDLADPVLRSWPGHTGCRRVLATTLLSGPAVAARTVVATPGDGWAGCQRIDDTTVLITALADDAHTALARRAALLAEIGAELGAGVGRGASVPR